MHHSVLGMCVQLVLVNDPLRKEGEWHLHIFVVLKICSEVEQFDVKAHISCIRCADDAVPMEFSCGDVCRSD